MGRLFDPSSEPPAGGNQFLKNFLIVSTVIAALLLAFLLSQMDRISTQLGMIPGPTATSNAVVSATLTASSTPIAATSTAIQTPVIIPTGTMPSTASPEQPIVTPTSTPTTPVQTPTTSPTAQITSTAIPATDDSPEIVCRIIVPAGWEPYVVRMGDTLYSLAKRAGVSERTVMNANCIDNRNRLFAGYIIYLPHLPAYTPTGTDTPHPPPPPPPPPPPTATPRPHFTRAAPPTATSPP